jgi:phenylalanyl-tRNA synthetase beta chain
VKVSLNWIREYLDFELPPVDELVEKIGAQLGAVEEVIDLGKKYQGIVIVKVVSVADHPDADRLHVCKVDDGGKVQSMERDENGYVQVVCGAPNVREGMLVAWLPPGATVPSTAENDPFVLEAKELRGVVSNGMLASAKELAIGDSHEGILELNMHDAEPGADFAETYKLNDTIIDIENKMFTHRPDCFGMLGVAREIAGILGHPFKSPPIYKTQKTPASESSDSFEIRNEIPHLVPRFVAQHFENITVGPSPLWLQTYLTRVGIRPISNIVDITNYMMVLTGQPLHAYDYDKVKALSGGDKAVLVVRHPHDGEKLTLLNGKEITPRPQAILIATDKEAIGLGGVMGGASTEVDENTKNIILECASFDMYNLRRTSMEHGIFSDAVTRFTKGQSPLQNDRIVAWTQEELVRLGQAAPRDLIDLNHVEQAARERDSLYPPIRVSRDFVNERLGVHLTAEAMKELLQNVEFTVEITDSTLTVLAPFWRTDVELREDVVEEIGRLHGFDKLPLELPGRDITPAAKDPLLETKSMVRSILSAAGANEVLTYSFVHDNLLEKVGQKPDDAFKLSNALSPDLQYYRLSLMPSLLEKVHPNIKAGYDEFTLFELGKVHAVGNTDNDGLPREDEFTALLVVAADKLKKPGTAYYQAKKYLTDLAGRQLTFRFVPEEMQKFDATKPYDMNRTALVYAGEKFLGLIGEFRSTVSRNLKLPKYCAGFELDTTVLQEVLMQQHRYTALPKYPKVEQDISLKVPTDLSYRELYDFVWDELAKVQPENTLPSLGPLDIYRREDDKEHKQITLRFTIASFEKTMTDQEVNAMLDAVAAAAKEKFGAERL